MASKEGDMDSQASLKRDDLDDLLVARCSEVELQTVAEPPNCTFLSWVALSEFLT